MLMVASAPTQTINHKGGVAKDPKAKAPSR
jgi:hypothetical protein